MTNRKGRLIPTMFGVVVAITLSAMVASCGGGGGDSTNPEVASCAISRSELGPFSDETVLGQSMTEDDARKQMAVDNVREWIAVSATGPWDRAWDDATASLGEGIHGNLSWIDVSGEIRGLFEASDGFTFNDLRVSRSFQGKIEHTGDATYLPILNDNASADFDAACTITKVIVGDSETVELLNLTDAVTTPPSSRS